MVEVEVKRRVVVVVGETIVFAASSLLPGLLGFLLTFTFVPRSPRLIHMGVYKDSPLLDAPTGSVV